MISISLYIPSIFFASLSSKAYDPALVQNMIQYLYDNALVNSLWTINHENIVQSYVHNAGFMNRQHWTGWTPEVTWMSSK